jgi:hypothetical protein
MTHEAENNLIPFPPPERANALTHLDRARQEVELAASVNEVKPMTTLYKSANYLTSQRCQSQ